MKSILAVIGVSVLLASDDSGQSDAKSIPLSAWGAGHAKPTGSVYYHLSVYDDGTNSVHLELQIINNTGHDVAIHKNCRNSRFSVRLLDAQGRFVSAYCGSGSFTSGPQEYLVFSSAKVYPDGGYCPCCVLRKRSEIARTAFNACSRVEVTDSLLGFLDDLRRPVSFEIRAIYDRSTNHSEKGQPTSGSSEPSQSSGR